MDAVHGQVRAAADRGPGVSVVGQAQPDRSPVGAGDGHLDRRVDVGEDGGADQLDAGGLPVVLNSARPAGPRPMATQRPSTSRTMPTSAARRAAPTSGRRRAAVGTAQVLTLGLTGIMRGVARPPRLPL